jgi:hypothetical protein
LLDATGLYHFDGEKKSWILYNSTHILEELITQLWFTKWLHQRK